MYKRQQDNFSFKLFSGVKDWNLKTDFDYYLNPRHSLKYGINYTYHTLTPNTASATTGEVNFETGFKPKNAHETGVYFLDDMKLTNKIFMNTGLRLSLFSQIGPYTSLVDGTQSVSYTHLAGITAEDLDFIIFATLSPDYYLSLIHI